MEFLLILIKAIAVIFVALQIVPGCIYFERKIAASERRLRVLSQRLLDTEENERKSLARDLHDEVGQLATAITIDARRMADTLPPNPEPTITKS